MPAEGLAEVQEAVPLRRILGNGNLPFFARVPVSAGKALRAFIVHIVPLAAALIQGKYNLHRESRQTPRLGSTKLGFVNPLLVETLQLKTKYPS